MMKVKAETTPTSYREAELARTFVELVKGIKDPEVLELGVKQAIPGKTSMHREWIPHAKGHYGTDFQAGDEVDFVADLHELSTALRKQRKIPKKFDVVISAAVFEHVLNPFLATEEVSRSMKPGGLFFITVPNCFPIHEFPNDYWRFTIESLTYLMRQAGLEVIDAAYQSPTDIICADDPNVKNFPSFLMVSCIAKKPEKKKITLRKVLGRVKRYLTGQEAVKK